MSWYLLFPNSYTPTILHFLGKQFVIKSIKFLIEVLEHPLSHDLYIFFIGMLLFFTIEHLIIIMQIYYTAIR